MIHSKSPKARPMNAFVRAVTCVIQWDEATADPAGIGVVVPSIKLTCQPDQESGERYASN
jgi:hypothetical protein